MIAPTDQAAAFAEDREIRLHMRVRDEGQDGPPPWLHATAAKPRVTRAERDRREQAALRDWLRHAEDRDRTERRAGAQEAARRAQRQFGSSVCYPPYLDGRFSTELTISCDEFAAAWERTRRVSPTWAAYEPVCELLDEVIARGEPVTCRAEGAWGRYQGDDWHEMTAYGMGMPVVAPRDRIDLLYVIGGPSKERWDQIPLSVLACDCAGLTQPEWPEMNSYLSPVAFPLSGYTPNPFGFYLPRHVTRALRDRHQANPIIDAHTGAISIPEGVTAPAAEIIDTLREFYPAA